jgi:hypothetical protein
LHRFDGKLMASFRPCPVDERYRFLNNNHNRRPSVAALLGGSIRPVVDLGLSILARRKNKITTTNTQFILSG